MKKILMIGELNQLMGKLSQYLSTKFRTQMCTDNLEVIKKMTKIFRQEMVIICLTGVGELDNRILDFFVNSNVLIPVLLVGTTEECKAYEKYFGEQIDFVIRPTTFGLLQVKCEEMLKLSEAEETETLAEQVVEQRKKNILAVDDNGLLLRNIKTMLEKDYEVSLATSGKAALAMAKKKVPDLILLDYEMPEWDGRRTLEEIRNDEQLQNVPVVFVTAVADKTHIAAVLALRPSGYLLKPIERQVLVDIIEKAMIEI